MSCKKLIKIGKIVKYLAAPVTARLMCDMGAEVIKVEAPVGDAWRRQYLMNAHFSPEENPVFAIYNTGKKHISLNLKSPEGKEAFHKLLSEADVFITNTRPDALKRLGFSYEDIKDLYPKLIYAMVLGYGLEGPDAKKPAFDTTAFWARSGFLRDMAPLTDEYYPVNTPSSVGDTATGYLLLAEINAALYSRQRTGKGDFVSSTLFHNGVFCMGTMAIITQRPFGTVYPRTRVQCGTTTGGFQCADGEWVFLGAGDPVKVEPLLFEMIGRPDLQEDPRFKGAERIKHGKELYNAIKEGFLKKPADEWVRMGDERDMLMVKMAHFSDLSEDPQAWANGYVEHVTFQNGTTDVMPSSPIEMSSFNTPPTVPCPPNGAHTVEVLRELGYDENEIKHMLDSGAAVVAFLATDDSSWVTGQTIFASGGSVCS